MSEFSCTIKDCGRRACSPEQCKLYKSDSMSEVKKKYLENPTHYNLLNYAAELERLAIEQKKYSDELWVDKHNLESEKAELMEFIKEINKSSHPKYICNQHWIYLKTKDFLEKHGVEI